MANEKRLIELAEVIDSYFGCDAAYFDVDKFTLAKRIMEAGWTKQEWISVKDRLPTIYDADADNCVLAIHKASNKRYYHWRSVADNPFDFTHWMRTPQPPKGE